MRQIRFAPKKESLEICRYNGNFQSNVSKLLWAIILFESQAAAEAPIHDVPGFLDFSWD